MLQVLCAGGHLQREEVLAAGDPAQWAAAAAEGAATPADMRVATTALLAACKAAGAVAQLPQLLEKVQGVMKQQPWGRALHGRPEVAALERPALQSRPIVMAEWAVVLAPVLRLLLPPEQATQLQEVVAGIPRRSNGSVLMKPDVACRVLGLLGSVVAPGAPGCSYPGCCNLAGRSEAEVPLQACSMCRGARYCCREHQVAHWKAGHKELCKAAQAAAQQGCAKDTGGA
jgi:hypothetical protein